MIWGTFFFWNLSLPLPVYSGEFWHFALGTKGTFSLTFPRAVACSPANHEPVIELVPGLVADASVKRQTASEWRSGECEVHPSLELLTCVSFSRALKGTSEEESSCLSDPEMSSLSRMQTKRILGSSFPNCLGKEEEGKKTKHGCCI